MEQNSVNYETYTKILAVKGVKLYDEYGLKCKLNADQQKIVKETMDHYKKAFPKVNAHQRIALKFLDGDDFTKILDDYIRPLLIKGAPAVLQDLKEFYNDSAKVQAIEKLLFSYLDSMNKQMTLAPSDKEELDPTVHLWLLYFIAYHFMWRRDTSQALKYVNEAIEHTPTLLELYTLKGKIYQKGGDIGTSAQLFEEARLMDTADRAINAISSLYQLRAGKMEEGEDIMAIFFKDCGYESSVHDNQCIWFEQVCGSNHLRLGNYRQALKQFNYIIGHLTHMVDDQYDYYLYTMRKFTLAGFEGLMQFNDAELYRFPHMLKATCDLVRLISRVDKNREKEAAVFEPLN